MIGGTILKHDINKILKFLPNPHWVLIDKKIDHKLLKFHLHLTTNSLASYIVGGIIGGLYLYTKHWTLNNVLGICFSIVGIVYMKAA